MKTNLGIETTDEERAAISKAAGLDSKMVSRKELTGLVNKYIEDLKNGRNPYTTDGGESREVPAVAEGEPDSQRAGHHRSTPEFIPSRGDEPYLFKASDPALRDIHSRFLDLAQELEDYTWEQMERNRDK